MKDLGIVRKFLCMKIEYRKDRSIKIHENQYIRQLLECYRIDDCSPVATPMDMSVKLTSINASPRSGSRSLKVCHNSRRSHVCNMWHQARYYVRSHSIVTIFQ